MMLFLMWKYSDSKEVLEKVNKEYWSTENGELYSVADARMLSGGYWYNEDILKAAGIEKVPKSWDEFQTMCDQISEWALNEKNEVKALQPTAEGYLYCMDHMLAGSEDSRFEGHNLIFQDEIFNNAINRMKRMYNSAISENAEYSFAVCSSPALTLAPATFVVTFSRQGSMRTR